MADEEHIYLLQRGATTWNEWRNEHPDIEPNFHEADLIGMSIIRADLHRADLSECYLSKARLVGTNLYRANLNNAHLFDTDFRRANLNEAHFRKADLRKADFTGAYLRKADFTNADLSGTIFNKANLRKANLTGANLDLTVFGDVDLSNVKGIDLAKHKGPSIIGIDTIIRSQGKIPKSFLRNAGVPDSIIKAIPSLVDSLNPIDFYSCFISYSSEDQDFAELLYADLQSNGVRCWFAPEDLKIGDKIRTRIDEAIRIHDKLLLILSDNSVESAWVEKEVETAFEKERLQNRLVLFPIRLDETIMLTTQAWAADIRVLGTLVIFTNGNSMMIIGRRSAACSVT